MAKQGSKHCGMMGMTHCHCSRHINSRDLQHQQTTQAITAMLSRIVRIRGLLITTTSTVMGTNRLTLAYHINTARTQGTRQQLHRYADQQKQRDKGAECIHKLILDPNAGISKLSPEPDSIDYN
jgi:hypothetical protein